MGACCESTSHNNKKSTQEQIQDKRKSKINGDVKIDTNLDESHSSNKLEKASTVNCLITGNVPELEKILDAQKLDVNDYNNSNKNFFHDAIMKTNKVEIIEMLIKKRKANINLPELQTGNTPIYLAAVDLKLDIVLLLLKYKPNIYHLNEDQQNVIDFLREWNNELREGEKRRSSLKRELSPEEKVNYEQIINALEDYKSANPAEAKKEEEQKLNQV